ncbi:MAG: PKD domain-containing protein [Sphingobacteriales bacterium]|nr:MAG: PKD domain-containing protein [Sphingobacteriales bacterium]
MNSAKKLFYLLTAFLLCSFGVFGATLKADFSISPGVKVCPSDTFKFDASKTSYNGSGTLTYIWSFGDLSTGSNAAKQVKKYADTGTYSVRLIVVSSDGLKDTVKKNVTVTPLPVVKFSYSTNTCQRSEMFFYDSSTIGGSGYIDKILWTFEPGRTSTSGTAIHVFSEAKTYDVKLEVWSDNGCYSSLIKKIAIRERPKADFVYVSHCQDTAIEFASTSTGTISKYKWVFPDGTTASTKTTSKTFSAPGSYSVTLVTYNATTGCDDSITKSVAVYDNPKLDFLIKNTCSDSAFYIVNKTDPIYGDNYQMLIYWDYAKFPARFDKINVKTTNSTISSSAGGTTFWKANTIDTIYHYYKGGVGTPNSLGSYQIKVALTTTRGCVNETSVRTINIRGKPIADFSVRSGCLDSAIQFTDKSTVPTGNGGFVKFWTWYFGDSTAGVPNISNLQNPTHKYKKPGTYKVSLIAATDAGCSDTLENQLVTVYPSPQAFFSYESKCRKQAINFTDFSNVTGGGSSDTVSAWSWNFGEPSSPTNTSSAKNPAHTYNDTGKYTVTLIAYSARGCSDTFRQVLEILPAAKANFTVSGNCERSLVTFSDNSTPPPGKTLVNYRWNFGDGNIDASNNKNVVHAFLIAGKQRVTLTITTSDGCTDSIVKDVVILPSPKAGFTNTPTCINKEAFFTNTTSIADPNIQITYSWNFGDPISGTNNTSTLKSPSHTFASSGTYIVKMVATSSNGCKDSLTKTVEAATVPKADFSFTKLCNDSAMTFIDASSVAGSVITQRIWYWGDGSIPDKANNKTPQHKFPAAGTYTVSLVSVSVSGCKDSIFKTVETFPKPSAGFTYITHCADTAIQFVNTSVMAGGDTVYAYKWDFDDNASGTNNTSNAKNPNHLFKNGGGTYNVKLTAYSSRGCTDVITKSVIVNALPIPKFAAAGIGGNICASRTISFEDYQPDPNVIMKFWEFGDGNTSTDNEPKHSYAAGGTYDVKLTVKNKNGCDSTIIVPVKVHALPVPKIGWVGGCAQEPVLFRDSSTTESGKKKVTIRIPQLGLNQSVPSNGKFTATFNNPGDYEVFLNVIDMPNGAGGDQGCDSTLKYIIRIYPKPQPTIVSDLVCFGDATTFIGNSDTAVGGVITSYKWSFKDGTTLTTTTNNISHVMKKAGVDTVTLTVSNIAGCTNTIKGVVTTLEKPVASFTMNPNPASILNATVKFKNTTQNISNFSWDFGDGFVETMNNEPTHKYNDTGNYAVRLVVSNASGCVDTMIQTLRVKRDYVIHIPNVVSPNGDDINDSWKPMGEGVEDYELIITNRWGEELFRTNDFEEYWKCDKNRNGVIVPEGVYIYYIRIIDYEVEDVIVRKGFINVIR